MQRARKLKTKESLALLSADDTDIFCLNWIDDHYPNRPKELEDLCLFDFSRWFDIIISRPESKSTIYYSYGEKYLRKRSVPHLINYYRINPKQEPESYYYGLLLLYKPWRKLEELKCNMDSYTLAFGSCKDDLAESMKYHDNLVEIQKARENMDQEVIQVEADVDNAENKEFNEGNILDFEIPHDELRDMNNLVQNDNSIPLEEQIAKLNVNQKRIFDEVINSIKAYCHEWEEAENENDKLNNVRLAPKNVIRKFVSGVGGTGKSFLINVLRRYILQELGKQVAVAAPTGIAAFNVNGLTLHRLLYLQVEQDGLPTYKRLPDHILHNIRVDLKDTALLIIDEVSMISNIMLNYIHLRLCEIFDTLDEEDGWFGRMNILLFGDLLQLKPVNEDPPYIDISAQKFSKYFSSLQSINLWKHLFTYDELIINVRQQSDEEFARILANVRLGLLSNKDYEILAKNKLELNTDTFESCLSDLVNQISKLPHHAICLVARNDQCVAINNAMLAELQTPLIVLKATDEIEAKTFAQKQRALKSLKKLGEKSNKTAGLEDEIQVKVGAKIMLIRNIEVASGLVNGSIGTITKVHASSTKIEKLTVNFENAGERELEPIQTKFPLPGCVYVNRKQFPIRLAYAITIHKSQGITVEYCIIDIGDSIFSSGQAYVALSRATSLNGVIIINLNPASIKAEASAIIEYNRLRKIYRPDLCDINVST